MQLRPIVKGIAKWCLILYVGSSLGIIISLWKYPRTRALEGLCQERVFMLKADATSATCPHGMFIEPIKDDEGNKYVICRCGQQEPAEFETPTPELIPHASDDRNKKGHVDDM
jgi:hypothetical protein